MPKYAEFQAFKEQNFITEADGDMLHRETCALAIRRTVESARTAADFENVLYWWDKVDANKERKERDHELGHSAVPLEWGAGEMYFSDIILIMIRLTSRPVTCTVRTFPLSVAYPPLTG